MPLIPIEPVRSTSMIASGRFALLLAVFSVGWP